MCNDAEIRADERRRIVAGLRSAEYEAQIRTSERAKIAAEYRSIAAQPEVLQDWLKTQGLAGPDDVHPAAVLEAVAGDIGSRLGGYTGGVDQPNGADPGHTGGACSTCYIRHQRGAEEWELGHYECWRILTGGDDG